MKTVLIGSDFMYDKDGVLKPIEINTNVGFTSNHLEDINDIFDTTYLEEFVTQNGFTKIDYIGASIPIKNIFSSMSLDLGIEFEYHQVAGNSITIPYVEDTENKLIIRSAYDTTAIVDEMYCKDKIGFLNLINSESFGAQFAYLNEVGELVSNITTIPDNGVHPNFILKARYPAYDKELYPKLYKVTTQSELAVILENVTDEYFIMEYYYNSDYNVNGKITKKRSLNILYPPTLQSIPFGKYTDTTRQKLINTPEYDETTFELVSYLRDGYITTDNQTMLKPKLLDTDLVQMADGTFKTGLELQIGDIIRTINIPNEENVDSTDSTVNYKIDLDTFVSGSTYSTNMVTNKSRIDVTANIVEIVFTDDSTWEDTKYSYYLVERDNEVRFIKLADLIAGDIVILIDTTNTTSVGVQSKTVQSTSIVSKAFAGWIITVERRHLFLTVTNSSTQNLSFAAIEHNLIFCSDNTDGASMCNIGGPCGKYQICCPYTQYASSGQCKPANQCDTCLIYYEV
jgi:hypothetical protein